MKRIVFASEEQRRRLLTIIPIVEAFDFLEGRSCYASFGVSKETRSWVVMYLIAGRGSHVFSLESRYELSRRVLRLWRRGARVSLTVWLSDGWILKPFLDEFDGYLRACDLAREVEISDLGKPIYSMDVRTLTCAELEILNSCLVKHELVGTQTWTRP